MFTHTIEINGIIHNIDIIRNGTAFYADDAENPFVRCSCHSFPHSILNYGSVMQINGNTYSKLKLRG